MICSNKGCNYQTSPHSMRHVCDTCFIAGAPACKGTPAQPPINPSHPPIERRAEARRSTDEQPKNELSGGDVNYYLLEITDPKRLAPYKCEAEDIIEAMNMTFAEGNVFKALWRSCAMRVRGFGKEGADIDGVYDGDKIAYYGERIKVDRRRKLRARKVPTELALIPKT